MLLCEQAPFFADDDLSTSAVTERFVTIYDEKIV